MRVYWSPSTGTLAYHSAASDEMLFRKGLDNLPISKQEACLTLSCVDDWQSFEGELTTDLLDGLQHDYWRDRTVSLVECLLLDLGRDLTHLAIAEIDELLQTRVQSGEILAGLLVAPLKRPEMLARHAQLASSSGYATTAGLLEELEDIQALLRRFADCWLDVPATLFRDLSFSKQRAWIDLSSRQCLQKLLISSSPSEFQSHWITFMAEYTPSDRSALNRICSHLITTLWPNENTRVGGHVLPPSVADDDSDVPSESRPARSDYEQWQRAVKQVSAAAECIAEGKDHFARKIVEELVHEQKDRPEYAVKSLCSLATSCKELFRTDFEYTCLQKAVELRPDDAWTLTQLGDYLKRIGDFAQARQVLAKAIKLAQGTTAVRAVSSLASVYADERDFTNALVTYKSIPSWEDDVSVRTAIGDLYRKKGNLTQAEAEFDYVIAHMKRDAQYALAGKAEIAKKRGDLREASEIYEDLVSTWGDTICLLAYSHVLKLKGDFQRAYEFADRAVRQSRFSMQARVQRAAILGLLGKEGRGLMDVPERLARSGIDEWIQQYVRGLLLLKLDRYAESRDRLVTRYEEAAHQGENDICLRLGAALAFLYGQDVVGAKEYLTGLPVSTDVFMRYITRVMELHIAAVEKDRQAVEDISRELDRVGDTFPMLQLVKQEIRAGNFAEALRIETDLLLAAASMAA
jgi:tetratricopeptide (TPR) repeat protein